MAVLREMDGLVWVHTNYEEALPDVRVRLDPVEASRLGITKAMASADLAIRYDGLSVGSLWEGDYALPIQLRSDKKGEGDAFDKVGDQYLPTIVPGVTSRSGKSPRSREAGMRGRSSVATACVP